MGDNKTQGQLLTEEIFRLMRNLRRRPSSLPHHSRGYNRLLRLVSENNGANSRELAELMDIRPSSLTEILTNLESDGMIRRERDENDMRVLRAFIKEAGYEHLKKMDSKDVYKDIYNEILTTEEIDSLLELCDKLSSGLEQRSQQLGLEPHMPHCHHKHGHHAEGCKDRGKHKYTEGGNIRYGQEREDE